ncbi:neprilysin-2-like [Haematobia irritans]|uniref:neprilysin-2-like n=1 Tax=Haematobia irritans TaxID=7368 RepID=UPI003F501638
MGFLKNLYEFLLIGTLLMWQVNGLNILGKYANRRQRKLIEGSMNLNVDPCENFYEYACGNWGKYVDGAGSEFYETLTMLDYQVNRKIANHMGRIRLRTSPRFMHKAYQFYKSCLQVERYQPLEYLRWLKVHENMKWPTLWSRSPKSNVVFDWVYTLAVMRKYGMNGILIEEIVYQKKDDPTVLMIDLDKPVEGTGFEALTYSNFKVMIDSLAVPTSSRTLDHLWKEFSEFEELLVKLDEIPDDEGSKLITVADLPLPWLEKYLKIVLNQTSIDGDMELYIQNIPYLEALDSLLKEYDDRFICKYLELRFLWHLNVKGPEAFLEESCASATRSLLPLAMHWLYEQMNSHIQEEIPKIEELLKNILKNFKTALSSNENEFNETTLDYLQSKLDHIQLKVGNLPRVDTLEILENHYKNVTLNTSDFYGNHLKLLHFGVRALHLGNNNTLSPNASHYFHLESYETGASSSPYFIQRSNIVIIPWTTLQLPVYQANLEDIYKYSSLGFLLAHEILHGFDITGLEVDDNGKLDTNQYNNILTNGRFDKNYRCLRDLNPNVIDEKIADVSGLRYAYDTYFDLHPEALNETRMIYGTEMSVKKLFFLNFAQFFCGSLASEDFINTSEHGSDSDRVNDALAHFPEFSKVYDCIRQSRMQINRTCSLWR